MEKLKIVLAGNYSKGEGYPRINTIINGLKDRCNFKEIFYPLWKGKEEKEKSVKKPLKKLIPFLKSLFFFASHIEEFKNADAVIVGFPGYFEVFFIKLFLILTGSKATLYLDYFFSIYESLVYERGILKKNSFFSKALFYFDRASLLIPDRVIIDTDEHRDFINDLFKIDRKKFLTIPVGESEEYFSFLPYPEHKNRFNVLFFGTFLNLHGIDKIKEAIKLLEQEKSIHFILVGKGKNDFLFKDSNLKNITFINEFISPQKLKGYIQKSHLILGIFGGNERAKVVIPCKIYDALACGRPVITGKTPAAERVFKNKDFVILCENNGKEIAKSILNFKKRDLSELKSLSETAYRFYKTNFSPEAIGELILKDVLNEKK